MSDRVPIVVPQLGVVESIVVVEWLEPHGSSVAAGDNVVLIDTDKAQMELPAPAAGTLEVVVPASDDEVQVGSVLGYIVP